MRIDRLELVNFRGFERLELELHPRLTLLVGVNGSGKSNALEGLAVALGRWLRALAEPEVAGQRSLERRDVRRILVEADGVPSLEPRFPVALRAEAVVFGTPSTWSTSLDRGDLIGAESTYYGPQGANEVDTATPIRSTGNPSADDWATLGSSCKDEARRALAAEQLGLCAYCTRRLDASRGARDDDPRAGGMRIEHWAARSVWRRQGEALRSDGSMATLRRMLLGARTPGRGGQLPPFAPLVEYYVTRKLRQRGVKT